MALSFRCTNSTTSRSRAREADFSVRPCASTVASSFRFTNYDLAQLRSRGGLHSSTMRPVSSHDFNTSTRSRLSYHTRPSLFIPRAYGTWLILARTVLATYALRHHPPSPGVFDARLLDGRGRLTF